MPKVPKGLQTVSLGSILNAEQIQYTLNVMQRPVSDIEKTQMLREYYSQFRKQFKAKGFDPGFLAHAVPYWISRASEQEIERERREDERFAREFIQGRRN